MNHLIFTAVLTACLGIGGYQPGLEFFETSPDGLGHDPYYDPGQLNSSQTGPWPPLVSPYSTLSIAMYTSMYYTLTYFAGSFGRYNVHAKVFRWLMTVFPIVIALTGFQFTNLLPYILQVVSTITGYYRWGLINNLPSPISFEFLAFPLCRDPLSSRMWVGGNWDPCLKFSPRSRPP
ncbi:hypothetical protein DSO57_1004930 [Entomophthora muscae]|uniref:Uncharacterized protein n=1 Tax=Entomophthora muscae TaxID=34485 RepID=A0ACC2T7S1_9FUNG|nr:hypothetical protein DSO57_1004930 [Entomophthora muscae]